MDLVHYYPSPSSSEDSEQLRQLRGRREEEAMALEHISRMLMADEEEDEDLDDHPALVHAQQSLASIISANDGAAAAASCVVVDPGLLAMNMAYLRGREEATRLLPPFLCRDRSDSLHALADWHQMIARMMLNDCAMSGEEMERLRAAMADEALMRGGREARRRRQQQQEVDLRAALVQCAQAVDDRRGAQEQLAHIRQHASPAGDGTQRLAHCFAEALEARLAGTGSLLHRSIMATPTSAADFLRAYRLFMATCCFEKVAFAFANAAILRAAAGARRLHIVDYGVHLGFQWPGLLRRLAAREGGPPEVTITGVDLPLPGHRPGRHVEEAARGLTSYAREVGVPLSFRAVDPSDSEELLRSDGDDSSSSAVVVVNSLFKLEALADDSVVADGGGPSPRDAVLRAIRRMRPAVFTHGVVNGFSGNSFTTRFRQALFYYSALFDVLDATMPRASRRRRMLERDILGPCALNAIACEGRDRTDRFDTYRQWQLRARRAGLRQLPLDAEAVAAVRSLVREQRYHRDFVIDEDQRWLLQGWKGRILCAHAAWVADDA